jgi:signal peptidase II
MFEAKFSSLKPWLGIALLVLVLDQVTKQLIVQRYALYQGFEVTSFFNIVRVHNLGAAFSFLSEAGGWQRWLFTAIALAASVAIVWFLRSNTHRPRAAFGLSLILGGAVGNLIDRLIYGYVVDFLDFHWQFLSLLFQGGHFPAFNMADSAITVGAAFLIWDELRK